MTDDPVANLISRCAAQDRAAFRSLYASASAKLFGIVLRILRDRTEAEDALQEVFTRVWVNAHRFDAARARGMTWLIAIARNHAIDRLRARKDTVVDDDSLVAAIADPAPGAEAATIARSEARRIDDCFATLEPDRASAVRDAYLNGLSYQELADSNGVPLNTMRSWLRRSLLKLKECLDA